MAPVKRRLAWLLLPMTLIHWYRLDIRPSDWLFSTPFKIQCTPNIITCGRLAPDTKILDMHMTDRELVLMDIDKVFDQEQQNGIGLYIPRTNETLLSLPGFVLSIPKKANLNCAF